MPQPRKPATRKARTPAPRKGANVKATERELKRLAERAPHLADGAIAQMALTMARELDRPSNSATSKSMCAGKLQDAIARLWELAPPEQERSAVVDLRAHLAERRAARQSAAPHQPRP